MRAMKRVSYGILTCLFLFSPLQMYAQYQEYYSFVYHYPHTRVSFVIGEMQLLRGSGDVDTLGLADFAFGETICCETLGNLSDSSRSTTFTVQEDDVLTFITDVRLQFASAGTVIDIADTLMIFPVLVDEQTGAAILHLDTAGVYPASSKDELLASFIRWDSLIFRGYSLPDSLAGREVHVKFGLYFSGHDTLDALCRRDILRETPHSEEMLFEGVYIDSLVYALVADGTIDTSLIKRTQPIHAGTADERDLGEITISMHPNPARKSTTVSVRTADHSGSADIEIHLYSLAGKKLRSWRMTDPQQSLRIVVTDYPPGTYYVLPVVGGKIYPGSPLHIVR